MSAKITASRRRAFLHHLTNTGNQTLSAERAKVSRSWVCLHRANDPEFDAACREAIAVAKMMLRDDAALVPMPPPPLPAHAPHESPSSSLGRGGRRPAHQRWVRHEGCELVVSGTNGRRTQIRRAKLSQWTPTVERRFLSVLAATCNVKLACREVGMWPPSAYNHRKRFPGFAKAWDQAIEIGKCELESRTHQNIGYFFDRELPVPDAPMPDICVMDAIRLVRMYDRRERDRRRERRK